MHFSKEVLAEQIYIAATTNNYWKASAQNSSLYPKKQMFSQDTVVQRKLASRKTTILFSNKKTHQKVRFSISIEIFLTYFHLILQPKLGFCNSSCGFPESRFSKAIIKSSPVTSFWFPGRESSICPR